MRYFQVKLGLALAAHDLRQRRLPQARARLQVVGDVNTLRQPPDRALARLRHAQVALAAGEAQSALDWLAPLAGPVLYTEVQAQSCATRLAAQGLLRQHDATALALADEALAAPASGRVLPALAWLGLRQTRRAAAQRSGDTATAVRLLEEIEAQQRQLAVALGAHGHLAPALQDQSPTLPLS